MSIAERAIHLQQLCACEQARMIFSSSALAQAPSVSCEEPLNFQPNLLIFQPVFSLELLAQKGQCQTLWLQQNAGLKGHRTTLVMTPLCSLQWRLMALVAFGLFILSDATGKPHFLAHLLGKNTVKNSKCTKKVQKQTFFKDFWIEFRFWVLVALDIPLYHPLIELVFSESNKQIPV